MSDSFENKEEFITEQLKIQIKKQFLHEMKYAIATYDITDEWQY